MLHATLQRHDELDDNLWLLLNRVVDWRDRYSDSLLEPDRFVSAFWGVRADVQNGGFHQYFANSAGDAWPDLLRLLVLGGDSEGEAHFRRVLAIFPDSSPSMDCSIRDQQLAIIERSLDDAFAMLDSEYYSSCFYPDDKTLFRALKLIDDVNFIPDPDENDGEP